MPVRHEHPRFRGISLPPSGWALAALLTVYIFVGLIGHDPWKNDDAVTIGIAYDIFTNGNWQILHLAGQPYPDAPLYYWVAASTAHLFSWLLPLHDAARLASGLFTLLALQFILLAARELHGKDDSPAAPLILAGSIGFLFHAHEAQPMLAALTAHTAAYWALTLIPRRPVFSALVFSAAIALAFLANGLLPALTLLPVTLIGLWLSDNRGKTALLLASALVLAVLFCSAWLLPLYVNAPDYAASLLHDELKTLTLQPPSNTPRYLNMLLWYAWPALPLATWALWSKRRVIRSKPLAFPILSFASVLIILGLGVGMRSAEALLLLPPLVLLAVPGITSLRRGAMNAFDWFGMMTFTIFAAVVWVVWSAMVFGWPERLARQVVRLEPGFVGHFTPIAFAFSALVTMSWFWLIITSPRSPMRSIMHWMAGLTLFWVLIAALWMPWIDYGKSFRPLSASLAKALPAKANCVANANLPNAILATLDYFDGTRTIPLQTEAGERCNWLLVLGKPSDPEALTAAGWRQHWEDKRPGDRRESDKFHLYRRNTKTHTNVLTDVPVQEPEITAPPPR